MKIQKVIPNIKINTMHIERKILLDQIFESITGRSIKYVLQKSRNNDRVLYRNLYALMVRECCASDVEAEGMLDKAHPYIINCKDRHNVIVYRAVELGCGDSKKYVRCYERLKRAIHPKISSHPYKYEDILISSQTDFA